MILNFLDREEEVKKVEEKYGSDKSEFVLIYGRRRIGKTELVKKFIEEKRLSISCARRIKSKWSQKDSWSDSTGILTSS